MIEISDFDKQTLPVRVEDDRHTVTLSQDEHSLPRDYIIMTRSQAWAVWHELGLMLNGEKASSPDPELVAELVDAIDDAICDDSGRVHANTLERHMQKHGLRPLETITAITASFTEALTMREPDDGRIRNPRTQSRSGLLAEIPLDRRAGSVAPRHRRLPGQPMTDTATCDCGAPSEGKWAGKHSAACASLAEPSVSEIARIIGRTTTDLDDGCTAPCDTDGGTCICAELYAPAAKLILARFRR